MFNCNMLHHMKSHRLKHDCPPHCCLLAALQGLPLLVFANKMDLPDALQPAELAEQMQLPQVAQRAFHIRGCSALRNEGVQEGMKWLAGQLQLG
jgi:signal recognition particle receptor subunit beta